MYVKTENNTAVKYPYSVYEFRQANKNVSFPAVISETILNSYNIFSVDYADAPSYNEQTQRVEHDTQPTLVGNSWVLQNTVVNLTDAEAQALRVSRAASVRVERQSLLDACEWVVYRSIEDSSSISDEWKAYRKALRDVPTQEGFPFTVSWPTRP